ncbi:isocitrate/isopropylmalate dehydrogenase family protein [Cohnella thailandensis]|uniref:3-isopropylmalate dehydrogenase n=1 Tax=Cohnella thailandensis TaxID=557557 RepID=A0A841T622_9BACL|nr:isocitrate/isopropylmalate dehydrogenase family protein [Cohnella thailandensis]MBB6637317.1 isocitrate/isopropylmalate dehydrogenase family protein [Cohnella thailandensis]MBP1976645.1 3-isopropylmalate dehydrogenase [Cohnella thailandensis]
MNVYKIAVLPGDGIGTEITNEALKVLNTVQAHLGARFELESFDAGAERYLRTGLTMPEETFDHCKNADAILMGAIGLPEARHPDGREVNGDVIFRLRFDLDLYAGVRPVKLYDGIVSPLRDVSRGIDYVIVRENIEGLYASRTGGCNVRGEVATDTIIMTKTGIEKISRYAFRLAEKRKGRLSDGASMVTCVDKANVLSSYAYFRKVFDSVGDQFAAIKRDYVYVDAMTLFQVMNPQMFDVVVAENMFADIISDLSSATVGGLGMAPSGDIGDKHALFQPAHGTAPSIAGKNIANPYAMILSLSMMLNWLGDKHADDKLLAAGDGIEQAVKRILASGGAKTADIGGNSSTSDVGDAVVKALRESAEEWAR